MRIALLLTLLLLTACQQNITKAVVIDADQEIVETNQVEPTLEVIEPPEPEEELEKEIEPEPEEEYPGLVIVTIKDISFNPQHIDIKVGDTVLWKHEDTYTPNTKHYIAEHTNEFRSQIMDFGGEFQHTFSTPGEYTYIDVLFKGKGKMRGTITVTE